MAEFIFKGDIDSVSLRQKEFISEILVKRGHKNTEITIKDVGKPGENFMANVKRITAKDSSGKTIKIIVKIAASDLIARKRTNVDKAFQNEAIMYVEILPKLVELQVAAGIQEENLFRFPECYGVLLEQPNELIILEDLNVSNYVLLDIFKPLKDNIVRMVLKNLAILHSLSLVWKKQDQETFSTFKAKLFEVFGVSDDDEQMSIFGNSIESDTLGILDDEKYKIAVRNTISKTFEDLKKIYEDQADLTQSVAIHGDGWTNNLMFRLQEGEPVECMLIDYQLSKVSSPACDILYMIFNCTDHDTRSKHYYEWIQHYHDELDKSLSNFGLKVDSLYPKFQLDADLKKYSRVFFSLSILTILLLRKPNDAAKVKQAMDSGTSSAEILESFQTTDLDEDTRELFKSRIEGIIDSYRQFGYMDEV